MELVLALSPVHLPAGGLVFRKGDEGNALFIVESGAFQVRKGRDERRREERRRSACTWNWP